MTPKTMPYAKILDGLGIEHEHLLSRLAGLEEAPEADINSNRRTCAPRPTVPVPVPVPT
jgi:hypothetical protein